MPVDASEFLKGIVAYREKATAAALRAVDQYGEKVLGDAQQLCPVDTGALVASATAQPANLDGDDVEKQIGFNTNYAVFVHENLEARHPVGQAKFLETAITENAPKLNAFVAAEVQKAMA